MTLVSENIIEIFKKEENAAFKILYKRYKSSFVTRMTSNNSGITKDDAIDIFQDSLIILYDKIVQEEILTLEKPDSYLNRIGQLLVFEFLRKKKATDNAHSFNKTLVQEVVGYEFLSKEESKGVLSKSYLNQIGQRCQELLIAFYYRGLTLKEIAASDNYKNANTVKSQKHKCLSQLKKIYNESRN